MLRTFYRLANTNGAVDHATQNVADRDSPRGVLDTRIRVNHLSLQCLGEFVRQLSGEERLCFMAFLKVVQLFTYSIVMREVLLNTISGLF